jgi:predicted ATPase/class 3 adenylate cyclase
MPDTPVLPSGTVTFVFTDIEGSTAMWERAPAIMPAVLARHDELMRDAIDRHGGYVFATGGDGYAVAFAGAGPAVGFAVEAQRAMRAPEWPDVTPIRVRMAINTGEVNERDGDYFGPAVNRTARMMSTAHGGQVVVSAATTHMVGEPPAGAEMVDRGRHRLKDIAQPEQIYELVIDGEAGANLRTSAAEPTTLPRYRTSFMGRSGLLATLSSLADRELVTLVGAGGAGKSRLAVEGAAARSHEFADGVWFVDLTTASEGEVVDVVLTTVGLPAIGGDLGPLVRWDALLVIDNCEHVLDDAANAIERILGECPGVRLVATSREALGIDGEQIVPVGPLHLTSEDSIGSPDSVSPAVGLFLDRARLADPSFAPADDDLGAIEQLCSDLDGLPLAIELAAARIRTSTVPELTADLFERVGKPDRAARRRPDRHRDLASTVEWSLALFDESTRAVLRRLAVFEGGFTIDAAANVAATHDVDASQVSGAVRSLVDHSMVQIERGSDGMRYRILEPVRAVALHHLTEHGELDDAVDRHAAWVASWSRRHRFVDRDRPGWHIDLSEIANQRAALRRLRDVDQTDVSSAIIGSAATALIGAGFVNEVASDLHRLQSMAAIDDPTVQADLELAELQLCEAMGTFDRAHELAERFRRSDDPDLQDFGAAIVVHHFSYTRPRDAVPAQEEIQARGGASPLAHYARAEIAIGAGEPAAGFDALIDALGVDHVTDLGGTPASGALLDLCLVLAALNRSEELAVVVDVVADADFPIAFSAYGPLMNAVVSASAGDVKGTVTQLVAAGDMERRWAVPLVDLDCLAVGACAATRLGRNREAAEALSALHEQPQRIVSGLALRRAVRTESRSAMGDEAWNTAWQAGAGRAPRTAFDRLVEQLAA